MAAVYTRPEPLQRAPFWDGSTAQAPTLQRWPYRVGDFPRGTTSTSSFIQVAGLRGLRGGVGRGVASLGALGQVSPEAGVWLGGGLSLFGAALGGALLGYVAAGNREGAVRGASLSAGITGVADGLAYAYAGMVAPAVGFGIAGAIGVGYAIQRFRKKRR